MKSLPAPLRVCLTLLLLVVLTAFSRATEDAELLVEGDALTPSTTLEVRFTQPMQSADALGVKVTSPLVVEPPLAGAFVWLSRSSGVFTPQQEPAMGATYTVSLLPGLRDIAGNPIQSSLLRKLVTPPFQVVSAPTQGEDRRTSPQPEVRLDFNREVKLEGAEPLLRFVNSDGSAVPASVQYRSMTRYTRSNEKTVPWEKAWNGAEAAAPIATPTEEELEANTSEEPALYSLVVEPQTLLTPGGIWSLEVKPGLAALTGGYTIKEGTTYVLGQVEPFVVRKVTTSSYLNSGRTIEVGFSNDTTEALKENTAAKFLTLTPEVKGLNYQVGYQGITISGDFARDVDYRLEVSAELRDVAGLPLSGERVHTVRFSPIKPRVYFPALDGHQMLHGERTVKVTSINMKSLRVQAQLVPAEKTVQALTRFHKYQRTDPGQDDNERYQAVAPKTMPGTQVFEKQLALANLATDQRQETTLDWNTLLGMHKAGMVLLTVEGQPAPGVESPRAGAQTLVQLTDLGVLWKKVGDALQVSVFSMATGQPVDGASVGITTSEFINEATPPRLGAGPTARTGATGTATLVPPVDAAWLTVRKGDDVFTLRIGNEGEELPMAAFRLPIEYSPWDAQGAPGLPMRALLFTERPLYHPGETAHLKGIVRLLGQEGLRMVARRKGKLTLQRPHEHGSDEIPIQTDEHGAFHADLQLQFGLVGSYSVTLHLGDAEDEEEEGSSRHEGFSTSFLAADYQPNAFEVKIAMPDRIAPGGEVSADVSGHYFFGAALGAAHARWTLQYAETFFAPEGFEGWEFGLASRHEEKALTLRGEGSLPPGGALPIRPRLPEATGSLRKGVLTVEVTDQNQQTITEKHEFTRDTSSFYLGMKVTEGFNIGSTESMGAMVIALHPDGTPLPERLPVQAELIRVFYDTVRAQSAGGAMTFHTDRREEVVKTTDGKTLVPMRTGTEWSVPAGETARFLPGQGGDYLLRVTAQDEGGRKSGVEYAFTVSGSEPVAWDYHHPAQVEIVADKAGYHPGDTARLLIKTPIAGDAMVTVERGDQILRTLRVHLEGNTPTINVPILAGDGPNVFVSMILLRGAEQSTHKVKTPEYRYGVCRLAVTDPQTRLAVHITPRSPKVEPGQEIVAEVQVREADGQPAAGAEVSFAAVDDGVLALTGYTRPEPLPIFEKPLPLRIRTGLSLFDLLPEPMELAGDALAATSGLFNKGYLIGGGGGGGKLPSLRTDFPGTAVWQPRLKTDAQGIALVKFKAPAALTSYRLVAVAYEGTSRFGSGESKVQISKRLILLSALGQFAHTGDDLIARAVVRNESSVAGTAVVSLELDGTAEKPAQPLTTSVPLAPGAAQNVDFPVKLQAAGTAHWKWTAQMEAGAEPLQDGLLATLQITSPAPLLRETYLPDLRAARTNLLEGVNPQILEGSGEVQVTVANTRLASLQETSRALLQYPYGCAEQTISSLLPWLVAHDFSGILPELSTPEESARALARGMQKLETMKVSGSGLSYWPRQPADLFASAYGALALALFEKQSGQAPAMLADIQMFLTESLKGMGSPRDHTRPDEYALALYALAAGGKGEPQYEELLLQRRTELSREGRALLACALLEGKPAPRTVEQLLDEHTPAPESLTWFGSSARESAIRLLAWSRFRPKDREVARLTQELLAARRGGKWRTTQENAWSLLALSRYFAAAEGSLKPVSGAVQMGKASKPFALTTKKLAARERYEFHSGEKLTTLEVANPQKGALYGEVKFTAEPPVTTQPRQDRGYSVTRTYYKIDGDGKLQPATELVVGDRIVVVLQLETPAPGHFVAIDDPLPAILEAVNPEFRSQEIGGAGNGGGAADYQETRADRVLYFCDHLPPGTHTFQYLARVRSAGRVIAPSTKAEEMYRPERFGLSAGTLIESKAP